MTYKRIRYGLEAHIATITLNEPDRLNAFTEYMLEELLDAFDRTDDDPDVRAVIVTGAGRAFCAGQALDGTDVFSKRTDLDCLSPRPPDDPIRDTGGRLTLRIFASLKPVIAAINGPAVGIGATMLLPMDHRIAASTARFGFVFARRGIIPEAASSWFLPRLVGISRALEWTLTGRTFAAQEALTGGLVSAIHPPESLLEAARAFAGEIIDNCAPVSVSMARQLMWQGLTFEHPMQAHRVDSRWMAMRGASADAREGVSAFLEKRPSRFPDRVAGGTTIFPWDVERLFR